MKKFFVKKKVRNKVLESNIEQNTRNKIWLEKFEKLAEYSKENNYEKFSYIKNSGNNPEIKSLNTWLQNQRIFFRANKLLDWRYEMLERIGFIFKPLGNAWEKMYEQLKEFKKANGHCNVSIKDKDYIQLFHWVSFQRANKEKFSEERIEKLNKIGFVWDLRKNRWKTNYKMLKNYFIENNVRYLNLNNKNIAKPDKDFYLWFRLQIDLYKNGKLSEERIRLLKSIGTDFNYRNHSRDEIWMVRYNELVEYKNRFGHCKVVTEWEENVHLAHWVRANRLNKDRLSAEKIKLLDDIGFYWDPKEAAWERNYSKLAKLKEEKGRCHVKKIDRDMALLGWYKNVRRSKKSLSEKQIAQLDALGIEWKDKDESSNNKIVIQSIAFRKEFNKEENKKIWFKYFDMFKKYGHQNISQSSLQYLVDDFRGMINWVKAQRDAFNKEYLPQWSIDLLNQEKFIFDPLDPNWNDYFEELIAFKNKYGHCNVLNIDEKYSKLSQWITYQKKNKKFISKIRIKQLNKIGLNWAYDGSEWEKNFRKLERYFKENNVRYITYRNDNIERPDDELYKWFVLQKSYFNKGILSKDKIELLNIINTDFNYNENSKVDEWEKKYKELSKFKERFGHCIVPNDSEEYKDLVKWIISIRLKRQNSTISAEQIKSLDDIGFLWNQKDIHWEENYQRLMSYKDKNGNLNLNQIKNDQKINKWLRKNLRIKDTLSENKKSRLETLSFSLL